MLEITQNRSWQSKNSKFAGPGKMPPPSKKVADPHSIAFYLHTQKTDSAAPIYTCTLNKCM